MQTSFFLASATVAFARYAYNSDLLKLSMQWEVTPEAATAHDVVKLFNRFRGPGSGVRVSGFGGVEYN